MGGVSHSHLTHSYRAFRLVRREISMALEKMKYQLRDWFAGTENYIGKAIHMPDGVGLTPYWLASDLNGIIVEDGQGNNPVVPNSKIIGLYNVSNTEKFVIARWTNTDNADVSAMFWVNEIFKKGGNIA